MLVSQTNPQMNMLATTDFALTLGWGSFICAGSVFLLIALLSFNQFRS